MKEVIVIFKNIKVKNPIPVIIFIFAIICADSLNWPFKDETLEEKQLNISTILDLKIKTSDNFCKKNYNKPTLESTLKVLNKYPDLLGILKSADLEIPLDSSMVPQGITIINCYIIITMYDGNFIENSKCYVMNSLGEIVNIANLDTKSHVGGIAYDKINELLWVPASNGKINAYDVRSVFEKDSVSAKYTFDNISDGLIDYSNDFSNYIDYLCIEGEYLYIGNFDLKNKGVVKKYNINNESGSIALSFINSFKVPSLIQGISFYNYKNQKYMVLSQSFGRNNDSSLLIFKYNNSVTDYSSVDKKVIVLPPMLEQNTINNNDLYLMFESNAKKYFNSLIKIDNILVLDISKIVDRWSEKD